MQRGRIHGYLSRVRLGRGKPRNSEISDQKLDDTDQSTDQPMDQPTDQASYRVVCTRLKISLIEEKKFVHLLTFESHFAHEVKVRSNPQSAIGDRPCTLYRLVSIQTVLNFALTKR